MPADSIEMNINEAAKKGDLQALRAAIKRGEDVNQQAGNVC